MNKLNQKGGVCFFLGSSKKTLSLVCEKVKTVYPNIQVKTYSPPYKSSFTEEENREMINAVNMANPDLLWIGMTAPKQEKWAYEHLNELNVHWSCIRFFCRNCAAGSSMVAEKRIRMGISFIERTEKNVA